MQPRALAPAAVVLTVGCVQQPLALPTTVHCAGAQGSAVAGTAKARPKWPARPPRVVRSEAGIQKSTCAHPSSAVPAVSLLKGRLHGKPRTNAAVVCDGRETRPARTPASQDGIVSDGVDERHGLPMSLSHRLMAGRTPARLRHLASMHLFHKPEPLHEAVQPGPGVSATLFGQPVYIVSVFTRRGVAMADVLPVDRRMSGGEVTFTSSARSVTSCQQTDLAAVGAQQFVFHKCNSNSSTLHFRSLDVIDDVAGVADTWLTDTLGAVAAPLQP